MLRHPPKWKTCKRYDIEGHAHFLTFSCFRQLPLLSKPRSCGWFLQALTLGREKGMYDLWAYGIMPQHVHLLLYPHRDVAIRRILVTIKQSASRRALSWLAVHSPKFLDVLADRQPNGKMSHRFWQRGGGYDRNIWMPQQLYEKIDYIHGNPVRRGLVDTAEHWPWPSCLAWQTGKDEPIAIDRDTLPPLET